MTSIAPKSRSGVLNVDGEEISRTETIPAHVWRGMEGLNLLAIKIPKEYGG